MAESVGRGLRHRAQQEEGAIRRHASNESADKVMVQIKESATKNERTTMPVIHLVLVAQSHFCRVLMRAAQGPRGNMKQGLADLLAAHPVATAVF